MPDELMDRLAWKFDQPVDSPDHQDLVKNGWVGGDFITLRCWLGLLLGSNLFRQSDESVGVLLQRYFTEHGYGAACLGRDRESWSFLVIILRRHAEMARRTPLSDSRMSAALEALLRDPTLSDAELAAMAHTTPKQVARMRDLTVLRKRWAQCSQTTGKS